MKKVINVILIILALFWLLGKCGGVGSVEDLYGTYVGTDKNGHEIKIELSAESFDEWNKYGKYYSDNLVYTDNYGRMRSQDFMTIKWTWDLNEGYIKVYNGVHYNETAIIDLEAEKMYNSWGEYVDGRNGFSYSFSN